MTGEKLIRKLKDSNQFTAEDCVTIYACVMDSIRAVEAGTFDPDNCYGERTKQHLREWTE